MPDQETSGEVKIGGRAFVIAFVAVFGLAVIGTTVARYALQPQVGLNQAGIGLSKVQQAALVWAERHDMRYPQHIALLQANNYFRVKLLRDPRQPQGTVWTVGGFDAYPFLNEVIIHDTQTRLDRTPLNEAVRADPDRHEPVYRFGDYFFVRLERPHWHGDLVFGWTLPDEHDRRFVAFDNNESRRVSRDRWEIVWQDDAAARQDLGLPPIPMPMW